MAIWQVQLESLFGTGLFDKAAVFSAAGDSVWAGTPGFNITPEELGTIIGAYSDSSAVRANGFHVAGHKYVYVSHDDRTLMGSSSNRTGVISTKTMTANIVGTYASAPIHEASKVMGAFRDAMIEIEKYEPENQIPH